MPSTSPHIVEGEFSPLETLALRAMRRFGESSPSTVDGEGMLPFIDLANEVVDELLTHPYWPVAVALPYYTHQQQSRSIPDPILLDGLLAKYARDQGSTKAGVFTASYTQRMNNVLQRLKFGVGATFERSAPDSPAPA